jgi:hypothetical protein
VRTLAILLIDKRRGCRNRRKQIENFAGELRSTNPHGEV